MGLIEFLFVSTKDELLSTITAYQGFVCQSHYCTSLLDCVSPCLGYSLLAPQNPLDYYPTGFPAQAGGKLRNDTKQGINYSPNYTLSGI
jgi:hypothetical protein